MKKTLSIRTGAPAGDDAAAPRAKRTISASRLDRIHDVAREQRRNPSEAEQRLSDLLVDGAIPGVTFKRKAVAGSTIVDFQCRQRKLAVMLGGDPVIAERDDRKLAEQGLTVLRLDPEAVLADPAGALEQVRAAADALRPPPRPLRAGRGFAPRPAYGRADSGRQDFGYSGPSRPRTPRP
ncbi:DUF559 domain-containing protein [Novosphingobium sp. KCTC 2891]|uniref:endonuclease domain-containing protein n=1 Tax=Novosphingobium sp. KCTC 2891 TaxID=2989730 RepID=UPI002222BF56|nr:DUF559 domain-containing protein [Novosphingobium sp. KCTC 2891]MCW1382149.1 DUF559 domain-containing protein [Novosphingobium sp. KCTC 2891]